MMFALNLIFTGVMAFAQSEQSVKHINVFESAKISSQKEIHLSDIAELKGFDADTLAKLGEVEIGQAPTATEARQYSHIEIAQILRAKLSEIENSDKIILNIPREIVISRKSAKLEAKEVETELLQAFKKQCIACEFELTGLVLPIVNQDFSGHATWKVRVANFVKGSFSIPLEVTAEDKRLYWVSGHVTVSKIVPVAKRNIETGESIKDEDFSFEKRDITYLANKIATPEEMKTAQATHTIVANQILDSTAIRRQSLVRNGESVKVFMGEDGWQVSVEGIAQQDAYKGDSIRVKIPRTQKMISGIATEKGLVEVR